ncbi:hypothetical protein N7468_002585 [Penicillium chermesinum]|uniref:GPI anchored protein n=1 Tax=Penicillium chermesinum TaxID=63820 RepID=A0A9W9PLY1_9EURO|nr:uncharacterized protein N7468_002585 [Penicillium chermesinum]KAJ5247602.1 hypothetical protein N7468_002585 [Penicillium chermesinum]
MHTKPLAFFLLPVSAIAVAQLEKKQYETDPGDSEYSSIYNSVYSSAYYAELSSLEADNAAVASNTALASGSKGPSVTSYPGQPPASIASVLATAVPESFLSQMANPSAASSIANEIEHGHYPSWYSDLPSSVKSWIQSECPSESGSDKPNFPGAASHTAVASSLLGAAGILAAAVLL